MVYLYSLLFGFFFNEFKKIRNKYLRFIPLLIIIVLTILYLSVNVITERGLTRSFWFHVRNDIIDGSYAPYFFILIFETLKILILFYLGIWMKKIFNPFSNFFKKEKINIYLLILFLIFNPSVTSSIGNYTSLSSKTLLSDVHFKENFREIKNLKDEFSKRDIIFITAESLERAFYTNKELKNLNLKLLKRNDVIDFTNIDEIYGYTDWTIAGLVAANCGIPIVNNGFYSGYNCLSDLLRKLNYKQKLIQGSSPEFAGNGNFYEIHNIDEIIEKNRISKEFSPQDLSYSHWGLHDHVVFNYALKEVIKLESSTNNYAIWINTLDNHSPNGFLSKNCEGLTKGIKEPILKTTYCTDLLINEFINNIFENDLDKDNLVVVHSDHLLMGSPINKKLFKKKSVRKNLFIIIDPYNLNKKKIITSKGNIMDLPATIIDYLGDDKKFGLGNSLLDKNKNSSLSKLYENVDHVLKKFEKNLKKINKKINVLSSNIIPDKKVIRFDNGLEAKLPVFIIKDEITQSSTDINGNPRNIFDTELNKLTKKKKNFNFESISHCNEIKNIILEFKKKCNYAFIKSTDDNDELKFVLVPFVEKENKIMLSNNESIEIIINKIDFINRIEKLNVAEPFFEVAFKKFRYYVKTNIESNYPKIYPYIKDKYNFAKYIYLRLYFKLFLKQDIPNNFVIHNDTFIAHAGGVIDEEIYTNSLESLNKNYKLGLKYFELDLKLTSDNFIVATHDWDSWQRRTGYEGSTPPSYNDFMSYKVDNKYSPLSKNIINQWFIDNDDAVLVTDKLDNFKIIYDSFYEFKDRLIVELFTHKSIDDALTIKEANILISERILRHNKFSEKYLDILSQKDTIPHGFAVHNNKVYENPHFFKKAKSLGFKIYVYGMDDLNIFNNEQNVLCDLFEHVSGIYSDKTFNKNKSMESYCN